MLPWLAAIAAGILLAALQYVPVVRRGHRRAAAIGLAALRALAVTLIVALLLDARAGRETPPRPLVALDASLSWTRGDTARWSSAVARARALAGDSLLLFGDSVRLAVDEVRPADGASSIGPLAEQAIMQGRPLVVFTDGELPDVDTARARGLPRGSRFVVAVDGSVDLAAASLDAPQAIARGDTLRAAVVIRSGGAATPAAIVTLRLGDREVGSAPVPRLQAYSDHEVPFTTVIDGEDGLHVLRAAVAAPSDREARNDTIAASLEISAAPGAVWISSAPDLDGRAALGVLRGALAVPTRGFLRVAPGTWRIEGSLAAVSEAIVREAARDAAMLVIHGDTAVFGPPRAIAGNAPLALLPGPATAADEPPAMAALDEWYPTGAPASPAASALAGVAWDSLPPVSLGAAATLAAPRDIGSWVAVEGRRARRGDARPFVVGSEVGSEVASDPTSDPIRRIVVSRATGMWRWQAQGGQGAIAYQGLWGALFDWLADGRRDRRAAVPVGPVRTGRPIRWRLSSARDSVRVILAQRDDTTGAKTVTLRRDAASIIAESPSLPPGVYDVEAPGGRSILVVNPAAELLPVEPGLVGGPYGNGAVSGHSPGLREHRIVYALIVGLLCAEWVVRRRRGLR